MRTFLTSCVAFAMLAAGTCTAADDTSWYADFYKRVAMKDEAELKRCTELLDTVRNQAKEHINAAMQRAECFDRYSGFSYGRSYTAADEQSPKPKVWRTDDILVVRIPAFGKDTSNDLQSELSAFPPREIEEKIRAVVLDLRYDVGGYISVMRNVLEVFAPDKGIEYMQAQSRCDDVRSHEVTRARGLLAHKRYYILVNEHSASASEWATAVLRYDWYQDTAEVIGVDADRTYGKNFMQGISQDSALWVTCGRWDIPGRPMVLGKGIVPDRVVRSPDCGSEHACITATLGLRSNVARAQ